eukprot:CAMPEP_0178413592 /NCGR_PEP_ID=MMETSP0689_2-20121128/22606_1 /TAXON_ID=160604 /ORGANISM="Amphidinium massartii, Strain CS-259" /LENGTH=110 /DNA_ID=CAMNT_0020034867 /DNA_START=17 /DNA_END=349 /DNA_ORIENTATION=+
MTSKSMSRRSLATVYAPHRACGTTPQSHRTARGVATIAKDLLPQTPKRLNGLTLSSIPSPLGSNEDWPGRASSALDATVAFCAPFECVCSCWSARLLHQDSAAFIYYRLR